MDMFSSPSADSTVDLSQDQGPFIIRLSSAMIAISGVAVMLRFLSRRLVEAPFLADDWMILVALPFAWTTAASNIWSVVDGNFGKHIQLATSQSLPHFFQAMYGSQIVYPLDMAFTKYSILLFYDRIFNVRGFKWVLTGVGVVTTAWMVATVIPAVFVCSPIPGWWDSSLSSTCIEHLKYYVGVSIPNITTDVVLLILPIPMVWKLQILVSQKIALAGIFILGALIAVVSTLRLIALFQVEKSTSMDVTWSHVQLLVWTAVETNTGIVCACLPSMRPLLRLVTSGTLLPSTSKSSVDYTHAESAASFGQNQRPVLGSSYEDQRASFMRIHSSRVGPAVEGHETYRNLFETTRPGSVVAADREEKGIPLNAKLDGVSRVQWPYSVWNL